jgi:hypothetical protein
MATMPRIDSHHPGSPESGAILVGFALPLKNRIRLMPSCGTNAAGSFDAAPGIGSRGGTVCFRTCAVAYMAGGTFFFHQENCYIAMNGLTSQGMREWGSTKKSHGKRSSESTPIRFFTYVILHKESILYS